MLKELFSTIVATIVLMIVGYFVVRKMGGSLKPLTDLIPSAEKLSADTKTVLDQGAGVLARRIFRGRSDRNYITREEQAAKAQTELAKRRARNPRFGVKLMPSF